MSEIEHDDTQETPEPEAVQEAEIEPETAETDKTDTTEHRTRRSVSPSKPYIAPRVPAHQENSPNALLAVAVQRGASVEELEKLMGLKERFDANEARKAYTAAMAEFKKNAPTIFKDKDVNYDNVAYSHATLGQVANVIASSLGEFGFSHAWQILEQSQEWIRLACVVTHELGHSESFELAAGPDTSGKKNPIQAVASTVTYLERYTLLGITGMAAMEGDDDARAGGTTYITDEQLEELEALIGDIGDFNMAFFLRTMGKIETLQMLPAARFNQAKKVLEAKRANR